MSFERVLSSRQLYVIEKHINNIFFLMQHKIQFFDIEIRKCITKIEQLNISRTNASIREQQFNESVIRWEKMEQLKAKYKKNYAMLVSNKSFMFNSIATFGDNYDHEKGLEYFMIWCDMNYFSP